MAGKGRFQYRGRSAESVNKRANQSGGNFDSYLTDVPMYKAVAGDNCVRILPATHDPKEWGDGWEIQVHLHYDVGPNNDTYLCLEKMKGEPCPVCEAKADARSDEEAKALSPSWRALCWVIDRDKEKEGPQLWSMPLTLFKDINARCIDKRTGEIILIDHPDEGFDVMFRRDGEKLRTKYLAVEIARDPSPLHDKASRQDEWLDFIEENPLPSVLRYYDYEHIAKVLAGRVSTRRNAENEEEDEVGSARGGGGRARGGEGEDRSSRRPAPRGEAEEEEQDLRSSRRPARRPAEEEEDAPWGSGDEEEVGRPRGREPEEPRGRRETRGEGTDSEPRSRTPRRPTNDDGDGGAEEPSQGEDSPSAQARAGVRRLAERRRS